TLRSLPCTSLFINTPPTAIYPLSLHDALPISAAGVGAGRGCALLRLRQVEGRERGAVQDVPLADLDSVEGEERDDLTHEHRACDDHGRTVRIERTDRAPLVHRNGRETIELPRERIRLH